MKLGIMQPYFFPYIGYFQLIALCDTFVIHDDVQYIKGGWINRNRILVNGIPQHITLPVEKAAVHLNINERCFTSDFAKQKIKIMRQIEGAYKKASYFSETMALVEDALLNDDRNVSRFVTHTLLSCCNYLNITTPFIISSDIKKNNELRGQSRVLDINKTLGANHYINPVGGTELYDKNAFKEAGLNLNFLQCEKISYEQSGNDHVPFLSIIDIMMFNDIQTIKSLLDKFDLI